MAARPPYRDKKIVPFKNRLPEMIETDDHSVYGDEERARIRNNLASLILAAFLIVLGWFLVHKLGESSKMQDCLISGRTNCAPIEIPAH